LAAKLNTLGLRNHPRAGESGQECPLSDWCQPRPSKGILVALMFMNRTLVSSGRLAM
jgi:hypothetical protein